MKNCGETPRGKNHHVCTVITSCKRVTRSIYVTRGYLLIMGLSVFPFLLYSFKNVFQFFK